MKIRNILLVKSLVLAVAILSSCGGRQNRSNAIQISGSDSEVNMVQNLAEAYMKINPEQSIAVTGGGSGVGIAALINGQTDIANSSRSMNEAELAKARENGVEPIAIPFAIDGLAVIVNRENTVAQLTLDQVSRVYQGLITNWSELGGPDLPITLYGRQSNSGTFVYFRDHVVKADYCTNMRNMNGTAQIVEAIRTDASGIGYVGIGYAVGRDGNVVEGISVLSLAVDENSPAFSPLVREYVEAGKYPISRALFQYVNGMPQGEILDFIRFELSPEGQQIVANAGYYPVGETYLARLREMGIIE